MKSRHLIYSIIGIAVSFLVSLLVSSCDPTWSTSPKHNASLVIFNDLEYPVSVKSNFDIRNGCLYADGERKRIIQPFGDTVHLVSNIPLGYHLANSFEDLWKNSSTEPIYYRIYKLNPETYEEEEMIKDWQEGSYFFKWSSWEWKINEPATKKYPMQTGELIFHLH